MPNLLQRAAAAVGFRYRAAGLAPSSTWGWISWLLGGTKVDYRAKAGLVYDNSAVSAAIGWKWRNLQYPRLIVQQRVKTEKGKLQWQEVVDHPFPLALENGPDYDDSVLWYGTLLSWDVDGNAYLYKLRADAGNVVGYVYIPNYQIEPKCDRAPRQDGGAPADGTKLITRYEYTPLGGVPEDVRPEDIVHLRHGIDPRNPMKGLSPLMAALREVVGDNTAATIGTALLVNGGIAGVAISPKENRANELKPEKREELKQKFRENTVGDGAGTPSFFPFPVDVVQLGYSPEQLNLGGTRATMVSRILAAAGIDPMVLGLPSEQKTYSNYKEANEAAHENTLLPNMAVWAKQLTRQTLRVDYPGSSAFRVWWDTSEVRALQDDQDKLWGRVTLAYDKGVIKRMEAKQLLGQDFDESDDDVYKTDLDLAQTQEAAQGKVAAKWAEEARRARELTDVSDDDEA